MVEGEGEMAGYIGFSYADSLTVSVNQNNILCGSLVCLAGYLFIHFYDGPESCYFW